MFTLAQRRNCTFEMYDIVRTMNKLLMKDDVTCNCISFFLVLHSTDENTVIRIIQLHVFYKYVTIL